MSINKGLIALAFGGLAIGMTEFTMMGILQDIAKDQQIEITQAAHFIALYALGVVVGAPILTLFTGKIAPKKILLLLHPILTHLLLAVSCLACLMVLFLE